MSQITAREFDLIGQQLNYETMMIQKYRSCYPHCHDPQLKMQCQKIAAKHEDNFIRLLNMLQ